MQAIIVEKFGEVEELKMKEISIPLLKENEVLIEQYATSINPSDWKKRKGLWGGKTPYVPGGDAAGIIVQIGDKVSKYKIGDRVIANAKGTYAEYAIARESLTGEIPESIPFTEAAGLPLAGQTAYQALLKEGNLKKNEKVLIHAGAGGVGTLAIQMAKSKGAEIVTTASESNKMFLYSLGADQVIDYKNELNTLKELEQYFDLILDPIGGETQKLSFPLLKKGGRLISLAGEIDSEEEKRAQIIGSALSMRPSMEGMTYLSESLKSSTLRTFVEEIFPFTELGIQQGHKLSEQGHVRGKLVIKIKDEN